ncbi:hypothetical protein J1792_30545 [Streptomyces triculaminicus]|uniref:Uncharacterized protein n=1 Tax=Streptomyces triculaminicus TaxID=2816232 RepID=A0A939JUM8_9ACTN|nr:hypothetical protein [Streptomyces triculaminicus]MBO0656924.1 hypothetical protein [Streptomyces triculaminicus]
MPERESAIITSGHRWMAGQESTDAYITKVLQLAATTPGQELFRWIRSRIALVLQAHHRGS